MAKKKYNCSQGNYRFCNKSIASIPTRTVRNRFLVLIATRKHGMEAIKALLSSPIEISPCGARMAGASKADRTATGISFSHFKNSGGRLNFDSRTMGNILGK